MTKWEGKPPVDELNEVIENDPAFWEIFVYGAPCYLSDTVSKNRKLCKGTRAKYYEIVLQDEEAYWEFDEQAQKNNNGIITLSRPPKAIELLFESKIVISSSEDIWDDITPEEESDSEDLDKDIKRTDNKCSNEDEPDSVIYPIQNSTKTLLEKPIYVVPKSLLIAPCRVTIKNFFPIHCGFAITVDKAQGQTFDRVIVTLSERDHKLMNFTYSCVYVGMSRVRESQHLRILLMDESNEVLQWHTLAYLSRLRKEESVDAFFAGFNKDRTNWVYNKWNEEKALEYFHKHVD